MRPFFLGPVSDEKTAMLYSLGAMTTFGNNNVHLNPDWQSLGAMEALQTNRANYHVLVLYFS